MDRFECYELCVQSPRHVAQFLHAVHGRNPLRLREDFCGTAAVSREWVSQGRELGETREAVGVDNDPDALRRAGEVNRACGLEDAIHLGQGDVLECAIQKARSWDVIFVGNFSIGYIHDRVALAWYVRASYLRLDWVKRRRGLKSDGVFVCDTFDGPGAFKEGSVTRIHPGRNGEVIRYTWEQREADALTAMVTCVLHFQVERDGEVVARHPEAFVYRWRLWSIPELRDAMKQVGFSATEVYQDVGPRAEPLRHGREMREEGIVCVVGRV